MLIAREYSSVSEMMANYARIGRDRRPMGSPRVMPSLAIQPPREKPKTRHVFVYVPRPLWQLVEIRFDRHERDWERLHSPRSMAEIASEVLQKFPGISINEIKGNRRTDAIVDARQAVMYAIYAERADASLPQIGRFLSKDHTTVLYAVQKLEKTHGAVSRRYRARHRPTKEMLAKKIADVKRMFEDGLTVNEMASEIDYSVASIRSVIKTQGWTRP